MTKYSDAKVNGEFVNSVYGSFEKYKKELKDDYCKTQLTHATFVDSLCKDELITLKQYNRILLPKNKTKYMLR